MISLVSSTRGAFRALCAQSSRSADYHSKRVAPLIALDAGGSSSSRWQRRRSVRTFSPLVPSGLRFMKGLYFGDQLVVEASRRFSLEGSLLTITICLPPLVIHLLLKVRKHLDELVLRSIAPCPREAGGDDSPSLTSSMWTSKMAGC